MTHFDENQSEKAQKNVNEKMQENKAETARKSISLPLTDETIADLNCGDLVLLSGVIYTARDAAHMRMLKEQDEGKAFPISIDGAVLYYAGPSPARPGKVSGSFGPTTSSRMDKMTVPLLYAGLKGMIGKGLRSEEVIHSMVQNKAVYFAAIGGAGALIARAIRKMKIVAYEDLGAEAIRRLEVVNFPAIVAIDAKGKCIYEKPQTKE